ncbi:hypothetical protein ABTL12_19715, partial [Acinetobacter baumannii]
LTELAGNQCQRRNRTAMAEIGELPAYAKTMNPSGLTRPLLLLFRRAARIAFRQAEEPTSVPRPG